MSLQLSNRIRQVAEKLQQPTTFSQSANKEMADELLAIADLADLAITGTLEVLKEAALGEQLKTFKHIVTEEDLVNNPELAEHVKVGDEIDIPEAEIVEHPDQIENTLKELTENNDRPGEIEPPVIPSQEVEEKPKKARKVNVKCDLE